MITCNEIRSRLSDYRDGEGSDDWRNEMAGHLSGCAGCNAELVALEKMTAHVFAGSALKSPAFLWTRVESGIRAEEERRALSWWSQWRWMARLTLVATLLVGLGSTYLFMQSNTPLESVLQGRSAHQRALQVASTLWKTPSQTAMQLVLGDESWAQN